MSAHGEHVEACGLRGSIFGTCWASIPTLSRKKPGVARSRAPVEPRAIRAEPDETTNFRDDRPWFALAIFAVALLVRLIHVWQIRRSPYYSTLLGDSRGYDDWARQIAAGDWLGHDVFYQAPLYPYVLG